MRWRGREQSGNVEDRRGSRFPGGKKTTFGIGTVIIIIIALLLGENPLKFIDLNGGGQQDQTVQTAPSVQEDSLAQFVAVVLKDTEDVWEKIFSENGLSYQKPTLVLFSSRVQSGCGFASAATGPFYCPADQKLYIDLSFYQELRNRFGADGDFAMAYVVAHEVGHHVQKLLGTSDEVHRMRRTLSDKEYNRLSVRLELQADFYAGLWAHHAQEMKHILDAGDIAEALNAANAIGDDRLQRQAQGYVVPDAFTHGTSEQRMRWFKKGFDTGRMDLGNTFQAPSL